MLKCVIISFNSILCMFTDPGVKKVECVDLVGKTLCVDTALDTECYQETLKEWSWEGEDLKTVVENMNEDCD